MTNLKRGAVKAKTPKVLGRNAVNSIEAKRAKKVVASKTGVTGTAIDVPETLQASLKGVNGLKASGLRANKPCNALGHIIASDDVLGGKNVRIDVLVIKAIQTGTVSFSGIYDELIAGKVVGAKIYTRKAMLSKWAAHKRHFDGNGKVAYQPLIPVNGDNLVNIMQQLDDMVKVVLRG